MNRVRFLMYGIAACVLALAGLLYAIGPVSILAGQKPANIGESSPWHAVLLSTVVFVAAIAAQHHLVARSSKRPSVQDQLRDAPSPIAIVAICCLGLLVSLCAAIFGWDLNPGLQW